MINQDSTAYVDKWLANVSRETQLKLEIYHDLLLRWQRIKNLVSKNTIDNIWFRHFADSAQLLNLAPKAKSWVDLGSGAGFPGLLLAILMSEGNNGVNVQLVESDHRKCAFLREVSRETQAGAIVHCGRIEDVVSELPPVDVVTARALTSLAKLVVYSMPLLEKGAFGLFLKGQDIERELIETPKYSMIDIELEQSRTDPEGRVVVIRNKTFPPKNGN